MKMGKDIVLPICIVAGILIAVCAIVIFKASSAITAKDIGPVYDVTQVTQSRGGDL